jgi:hypothetical protein
MGLEAVLEKEARQGINLGGRSRSKSEAKGDAEFEFRHTLYVENVLVLYRGRLGSVNGYL